MRFGYFIAAFCLASACYHPDLTGVKYRCDDANPFCPEGQSCVAGFCQSGPGVPDAPGPDPDVDLSKPGPGGDDMSMPPLIDMSMPGPTDMAMPVDPAAGCALSNDGKRYGAQVGTGVYACRGIFNEGAAATLCDGAYQVCANATGIDLARCAMVGGFYASAGGACRNVANNSYGCATENQCGEGQNRPLGGLMGCGSISMQSTYNLPGDRRCSGFRTFLDCIQPDYYRCDTRGIGNAQNERATNGGVLCCKK